eukprot:TRINITY_DN27498_c0_g1_i1.p1 TRINITY_DN27498_c0_g1~~TRINITY_DN27498_c0_g1_i1.p1  ORF type:complete len:624 (-),score=63.98 TRINITY_DN27498_c0_g1_i1:104-1975(-)
MSIEGSLIGAGCSGDPPFSSSGKDSDRFGSDKPMSSKMPERFTIANVLDDLKVDDIELDRLNTRYMEYSRVALAMGCFFFCTGLQWSVYIGDTASYAEMKQQCHHNEDCNLVGPSEVNWMGLNPDMTWSNFVYFITAALIYAASWYHRSDGFRAAFGSAPVVPMPESSVSTIELCPEELPSSEPRTPTPTLSHAASMVGHALIGRPEFRSMETGLYDGHHAGMYFFTATAILVEGGLSALYHTCPSKTFQQFDYIGITTCEIAIFLMMWSKCHPRLPTAGTMGLYVAMLGLLAAMESSLPNKSKPVMWIVFGFWICIMTPFVAVTLNYGLPSVVSPCELYQCIRTLIHQGIVVDWKAIGYLVFIVFLMFVYIAMTLDTSGWLHTLVVVSIYIGFMAVLGLIGFLFKGPAAMDDNPEESDIVRKLRNWVPVKLGLFVLWMFFGLDRCVQGASYPAKHNLSHGIMIWHGQGAVLYFAQFYAGLFYFKMITPWGFKFLRAVIYFFLMMLCGLLGGDYFVNGTYKANAEIRRYGITCDVDGKADDSLCTKAANSLLDADYPCKMRRSNYTCLVGSLDYNDGCSFVPGMDGHSLWHIFSAIALYLLPMSFTVVDDLLCDKPRHEIAII